MVPVLRIVIPAADMTEALRELGGEAHCIISRGANLDYITEDRTEDKPVPAAALYAARMNERGQISVVRGRQAALTPDHTFLGWPIPA